MTVDRTDATDEEFRARFDRFGIFESEQREAAILEEVARALREIILPVPGSYLDMNLNADQARRLAVAAVAAYRATLPQVDVLLDGELRHTLTVTLGGAP